MDEQSAIHCDSESYLDVEIVRTQLSTSDDGGPFVHCGGEVILTFYPKAARRPLHLVVDDQAYRARAFDPKSQHLRGVRPHKRLCLKQSA